MMNVFLIKVMADKWRTKPPGALRFYILLF